MKDKSVLKGFLHSMNKLMMILEETNRLLEQHFQNNTLEIIAIVISGIALVLAIWVPFWIANKQNKISLFEKRFDAYSDLLKLKAYAAFLKNDIYSFSEASLGEDYDVHAREVNIRRKSLITNFGIVFGYFSETSDVSETVQKTLSVLKSVERNIQELPMLYSKKLSKKGAGASAEITDIFDSLDLFMTDIVWPVSRIDDRNRTDFIERIDAFVEKYTEIFEKGLRL